MILPYFQCVHIFVGLKSYRICILLYMVIIFESLIFADPLAMLVHPKLATHQVFLNVDYTNK